MWTVPPLFALALVLQLTACSGGDGGGPPMGKIHGVNLGSWLVLEPWMLPQKWVSMGGETCFQSGSCDSCAASEFDLVQKLGQAQGNNVFQDHWNTWFTQNDVDNIARAGLNTVRIPIGYWIVESLVDRTKEFYAQGGIWQLKRAVKQLKAAGVYSLVDFHAMPGIAAETQMFAGDYDHYESGNAPWRGRCTKDVKFYTPENYFRALIWASTFTYLLHIDADFAKAFALEAVNEPLNDPNRTPGYGDYLKDFTSTVRAMEKLLGIECAGANVPSVPSVHDQVTVNSSFQHASSSSGAITVNGNVRQVGPSGAVTVNDSFNHTSPSGATSSTVDSTNHARSSSGATTSLVFRASKIEGRVGDAIRSSMSHIKALADQLKLPNYFTDSPFQGLPGDVNSQCLYTTYMDALWQNLQGSNPSMAAQGPAMYDNHIYFSFGGVADANAKAYLSTLCKLSRVGSDSANGNNQMFFGEWSLATEFKPDDKFLTQWADAQKLMYSQGLGWIFWAFKIEDGNPAQSTWDYFSALKAGHFTPDPTALRDPHVCDPYR